jgi:ferredoxin-NADP reductase
MELTLVEKRKETLSVVSFFFKPAFPILWTPGQYLIYTLDHQNPDLRGKMRFFTISSAPFENHITITTNINDKSPSSFKKTLNQMQIGGKIKAKGPDGNFVVQDLFAEYIFIAGGIGITPFRSIIIDLANDKSPINITLLYTNKNEDILFKNELEKITKSNPNIRIDYFISPARITKNSLKKIIPDLKKPLYYISGPNPMVEDMVNILKSLNVEDEKIKSDYFDGYQTI